MMDKLISSNKTTFLQIRLLVDIVVEVNEVIILAKRTKKACFIFKVDFWKSND